MFCVIFLWSRYTFIHFLSYLDKPINSVHPSASSCFLLFFYFSFPPYKKCQKNSGKNTGKISVQEASKRAREGPEGIQGGARRPPSAAPLLPAPGGRLGPLAHLWLPPFAYLSPVTGKLRKRNPIPRTRLCSAAAALPRSGAPEDLFPAPCRREFDLRECPLHHGCSPDVP